MGLPNATEVLERGDRVWLRRLQASDQDAFLAMVAASRSLHHPWITPPLDEVGFQVLLARSSRDDFISLIGVRRTDSALVAVVNFSQIARGGFQSCYCGYFANVATAGQGLTRETLELALRYIFTVQGLHRVEVNIQPGNTASLALARRLGFRHEGFSPRYLYIDGAWRDHERFAITAEEWLTRE
jgi:ribosomal-protein-alanine N-acetyltransferase